ncbi:MAG: phytanoyl-CoA dioxygenase family protein [Actinomycetota bacterium]
MSADDPVRSAFERDGYVVLPGHLGAEDLSAARGDLDDLFPSAAAFHGEVDPERNARFRDEFGGIVDFPFESVHLSALAVHPRIVELVERLLDTTDLRVYSIEAWAKYTGAADYDQPLHRDYLNHSLLVPADDRAPDQVECFVYLDDVPSGLGPTAYLPQTVAGAMPALPNWYPRTDGEIDETHPTWAATEGRPDLYDREVLAVGPAGTVASYRIETFHRGTALTEPEGARFTVHVSYRRAEAEWIGRRGWTDQANTERWRRFVVQATPRQLELFGFPPVGHPYWTPRTLDGLAERYPGLDTRPWQPPDAPD